MPDVMMAAGVDTAGNVDVQPSEVVRQVEIAEPAADLLRHRDGARIGEAAIVEARASDDVGDQVDVGRGNADLVQRPPKRRKIALGDVRQREVLFMADANFAETVTIGEVGDGIHLLAPWRRPAALLPA